MSKAVCYSFHPGHNIYHETVDSFNQPRTLVDITHVMNNAFLVTTNGVTEYWFHHMPHRLLDALTRTIPEGIEATEDKRFIFVYTGGAIERFNMSQEKISDCFLVTERPELSTQVATIIKSIHANNIKKLIERGISG
jgi:hypothetical protein